MLLPPGIRHFKEKALLVTVDSQHVKGYLAEHDVAETAFMVDVPAENLTQEKQHIPTGDSHPDKHLFHDHVAKLGAAELAKHAKDVKEIFLFVPARYKNEFQEALSPEVRAKITHVIEGDVTNDSPIDLAKRLTL